jgi:hypothetical protein
MLSRLDYTALRSMRRPNQWQASQKHQTANPNAVNCLQFLKWGNNETERHSGVVRDQLYRLSSRRGAAEFAIGNDYFLRIWRNVTSLQVTTTAVWEQESVDTQRLNRTGTRRRTILIYAALSTKVHLEFPDERLVPSNKRSQVKSRY